jgi:hypothetical protein
MTVIELRADEVATSPRVEALVRELRARADGFVFLCGGAAKIPDDLGRHVRDLLGALAVVAARGIRFAVGDGGTRTGLAEIAGAVRTASRNAFLLLGVAPAADVAVTAEPGKAALDPAHSHVVTVHDPDWVRRRTARGWDPSRGHRGSEIPAMYAIFGRLARDRPSVAIAAHGDDGMLEEVGWNLRQERPVIVVAGSGHAADAIVAVLRDTSPAAEDARALVPAARRALGVVDRTKLIEVVPLEAGADALAARLVWHLAGPAVRR